MCSNIWQKKKKIDIKTRHDSDLCEAWLSPLTCFHHPLYNPGQSNENGAITSVRFHKPACIALVLVQGPTLAPGDKLKLRNQTHPKKKKKTTMVVTWMNIFLTAKHFPKTNTEKWEKTFNPPQKKRISKFITKIFTLLWYSQNYQLKAQTFILITPNRVICFVLLSFFSLRTQNGGAQQLSIHCKIREWWE